MLVRSQSTSVEKFGIENVIYSICERIKELNSLNSYLLKSNFETAIFEGVIINDIFINDNLKKLLGIELIHNQRGTTVHFSNFNFIKKLEDNINLVVTSNFNIGYDQYVFYPNIDSDPLMAVFVDDVNISNKTEKLKFIDFRDTINRMYNNLIDIEITEFIGNVDIRIKIPLDNIDKIFNDNLSRNYMIEIK